MADLRGKCGEETIDELRTDENDILIEEVHDEYSKTNVVPMTMNQYSFFQKGRPGQRKVRTPSRLPPLFSQYS